MTEDNLPLVRNQREFRKIVSKQWIGRHIDMRPIWRRCPETIVIGLIVAAVWANAGWVFSSLS